MDIPESGVDFLMAEVAARIAAYLRQAFPGPSTTKQVALAFDVAIDTAKGWLGGQMPINRHLLAMKARFGAGFVAFIYEPMSWAGAYSLRARLDDLRAGIDELKAELDRQENRARSDRDGVVARVAGGTVRGRGAGVAANAEETEGNG